MLTYSSLSTHKKVTVTDVSTEILPANARRVYSMIRNTAGASMWIGKGETAVVGEGQLVRPGEWCEINVNTNPFIGSIHGILESGSSDIPVEEAQI